jgi:hypothetical protein
MKVDEERENEKWMEARERRCGDRSGGGRSIGLRHEWRHYGVAFVVRPHGYRVGRF